MYITRGAVALRYFAATAAQKFEKTEKREKLFGNFWNGRSCVSQHLLQRNKSEQID